MRRAWITPLILACLVLAAGSLAYSQSAPIPATNFPKPPLNTLTDQEKADGWQLLFNGENFDGWEFDTEKFKGEWKIVDGVLIAEKGPSHLFTAQKFTNFEACWDVCTYDVRVPKFRYGNSGIFVRCVKTGSSFPKGYEVQVDPYDVKNPTGGIYGMAPGNLLVDENGHWKPEAFMEVHEGKWINQRVRIVGNHIMLWVNGQLTLDWTDEKNSFPEAGFIALQCHHSTDVVLFTNIKIKVLD